jgi:hypothetical protein
MGLLGFWVDHEHLPVLHLVLQDYQSSDLALLQQGRHLARQEVRG